MARRKKNGFDFKSILVGVICGVVLTHVFSFITSKKIDTLLMPEQISKVKESALPNMKVRSKETKALPVKIKDEPAVGKIALVIDDWGYTSRNCHFMEEIKVPFAVAILPNLPHTSDIAECARQNNKDVMLHLPMEPNHTEDSYPEDYLLKTSMGDDKVRQILATIFERMPWVRGVNNHMGSKATADHRLMSIVLEELKKRDLFFVDSLVTSKTIAEEVASQKNVPFVKRDVFLDNINRRSNIESEFSRAADIARRTGSAVLIGHDRPLTLQIIKEQVKKLQDQGFQIVSIAELLR